MNAYARTHTGNYRELNEDSLTVEYKLGLVGVADGMGGHQAGEVASKLAVAALVEALLSETPPVPTQEYLRQAVIAGNSAVFNAAREDAMKKGMGTTLTCALFHSDRFVLVAHVGDSRAYLFRDGRLSQITRDHSLVGELLVRGIITRQQAMVHPHRNIITRSLGTNKNEEVDMCQVSSRPGDVWLICSDGLSNSISNEEIEGVLSLGPPWEDRADTLLALALANGGFDNITFIIATPDHKGDESPRPIEPDIDFDKTREIPIRAHNPTWLSAEPPEGGEMSC